MLHKHQRQRLDNRFANRQRSPNSFYSHIRTAAITLKLHGLFPFENLRSDDGRSLSFKWFGWSTLWGFSLYIGSSIVLGLLSFYRSGSRTRMYAYVAQSFLYYGCHLCNYRKFPRLLRAMEYINDRFVNELGERVQPRRVNAIKFWIIFEVVAVTLPASQALINLVSKHGPTTTAADAVAASPFATLTVVTTTVVNSYLEYYISVMYLVMTSLILLYYERLNRRLHKVLDDDRRADTPPLDELENLRTIHADLVDASNQLEEWFSLTMISVVLSMISRTLLKAVLIFFVTRKISLTNDFLQLLFTFLHISILTTAAHKLVKSSFEICNIVRGTSSASQHSSDIKFQCRLAIMQTTVMPVSTKALGLFVTSRPLLPCILSTIVLYIIVIIELEMPIKMIGEQLDSGIFNYSRTN